MTAADENYEDEYSDYEEYDDDEEEGTLSGLSVLLIGIVMLVAFAGTTYFFYQKGMKEGARLAGNDTPYVAADPEPIKIENSDEGEEVADREVYDVFDGEEPADVTVIAEGPEEPVDRNAADPIGAIAEEATDAAGEVSDAVQDRLASLAEEDASILDEDDNAPAPVPAQEVTPVSTRPVVTTTSDALSGGYVVQVGAFRSNEEALAQWNRMKSRMGAVIGDKTFDIERADLGDRGVYHRLRVGPFSSSDSAKSYCAALKENGQDCLIKGV